MGVGGGWHRSRLPPLGPTVSGSQPAASQSAKRTPDALPCADPCTHAFGALCSNGLPPKHASFYYDCRDPPPCPPAFVSGELIISIAGTTLISVCRPARRYGQR
ncbi:hypothetical protein FRC08_005409 [Ceratobasidium sp. 394]|nr:hypothetical protein FRC08_005409 [Ceratobasidium sp. 394]